MNTHSWPSAIAHVDGDCFFASCEIALDHSLAGKAIAVIGGGSQKGVVTSPSYEARAMGLKTGMPTFQARRIAPRCLFIEGHFEHYGMLSRKMFSVLDNYSPVVEEASIDEGYVDLTGLRRMHKCSYGEIAKRIQDEVARTVGIPVSIGVTPTKVLSKIASDFRKPKGLVIVSARRIDAFLQQVLIKDIPGVGPNSQALLAKYNVVTAGDYVQLGEQTLKKLFGKRGIEMRNELTGNSMYAVTNEIRQHKSISRSRTLEHPTSDAAVLRAQVLMNVSFLTMRLRRYGLATKTIGVFLRDQQFGMSGENIRLPRYMRIDDELIPYALALFRQCYRPGTVYRLTGVALSDLAVHSGLQPSLFDDVQVLQKQHNMAYASDLINNKFGRGTLTRASTKLLDDTLIVCSFKKGRDMKNTEL